MTTDSAALERIAGRVDAATIRGCRLPQRVFREEYDRFACIEFDIFSGECFWKLVQGLAATTRDGTVACAALDPDPVEYFFREFGMYGVFEIGVAASEEEYFAALSSAPKEWPVDSLLHNSEVLVWCPPSLEWVMWGERSLTVVMLAVRVGFAGSISSIAAHAGVRLFTPSEAVANLISANFRDGGVPPEWKEKFLTSYRAE